MHKTGAVIKPFTNVMGAEACIPWIPGACVCRWHQRIPLQSSNY